MSITKLLGRKFFTGKKNPDSTTSPQQQISRGGGLPKSPVQAANAAPDMRVGAGWGAQIQPLPTDGTNKNLQAKTHPCKMANGLPKKPACHSLNPSSSQSSARKRHSKADKVSFMRTALNKSVSVLTALCMVPALSFPSGINADELRLEMLSDDAAVTTTVESDEAQADTNIVESDPTDTAEIPTATSADDPDDATGEDTAGSGDSSEEDDEAASATASDSQDSTENEVIVSAQATQTAVNVSGTYFYVTGGVKDVDWTYTSVTFSFQQYAKAVTSNNIESILPANNTVDNFSYPMLKILTSTPITISTSAKVTNAGIYIDRGVEAHVTFAGVNINSLIPLNIATNKKEISTTTDSKKFHDRDLAGNNTTLYLTLADNTTNNLTQNLSNVARTFPAIRCGDGSKLVIDDARVNVDYDTGKAINLKQGRVDGTHRLVDENGNIITIKDGARQTLLDSANPGVLNCSGGYSCAAIGGGTLEDCGELVFNGGTITATASGTNGTANDSRNSGTGIGGGLGSGGTSITFNGGNITAKAAYHGAGIGSGWTYTGYTPYVQTDAILTEHPYNTLAGDITINGGLITSYGGTHGNAFGRGCGGNNNGHTIKITGGTLLPVSYGTTKDIGGNGGEVIITGGSVRLTGLDKTKFESIDNKAYSYDSYGNKVEVMLTKIDLSGYKDSSGSPLYKNALVDDMEIKIAGLPSDYGMAKMTDSNCALYFWLPTITTSTNREVQVDINIIDSDGKVHTFDPFFIPDVIEANNSASSGVFLKQYITFNITAEKLAALNTITETITDSTGKTIYGETALKKRYDGTSLDENKIKETIVANGGISVDNPANGALTNTSSSIMTFDSQGEIANKDEDGNIVSYTVDSSASKTSGAASDVGLYQLTITSTQYASDETFANSFWGHRATIDGAEITPANSRMSLSVDYVGKSKSTDAVVESKGLLETLCDAVLSLLGLDEDETQSQDDENSSSSESSTAKYTTSPSNLTVKDEIAADKTITLTATVAANDGTNTNTTDGYIGAEETTCAAPTGYVVFKANGQELAKVELNAATNSSGTQLTDTEGYHYSTATFEWTPSSYNGTTKLVANEDGKYEFTAEYIGYDQGKVVNYNSSSAVGVEVLSITPVDQDTTVDEKTESPIKVSFTPVDDETFTKAKEAYKPANDQVDNAGTTTLDASKQSNEKSAEVKYNEDENLSKWIEREVTILDSGFTIKGTGGLSLSPMVYSSSDTSVASIDPETGKVTIHKCGVTYLTVTNPTDGIHKDSTATIKLTVVPVDPVASTLVDPDPDGTSSSGSTDATEPTYTPGILVQKSGINKTDPTGPTQVDDVITYTLTISNTLPGSLWKDVYIYDPLPVGLAVESGSMKLAGPSTDSKAKAVDKSYYDSTSREINVPVGDVAYGDTYTLTFDVRVKSEAMTTGGDYDGIWNTAQAKSSNVNPISSDRVAPNTGAIVYPADDEYSDPEPGLVKSALNDTAAGEQTSVEDRITYTINVQNKREGSVWRDVVLQDPIPEGLNVDADSMYLTKPDGTEIHVSSAAYNLEQRLISIYVGDVYGGETYTLSFDVVVTEEAVGGDIGNTAEASGGNAGSAGRWWSGGGYGGSGGSGGWGGSGSGGSGWSGGSGSGSGSGGSGSGWGSGGPTYGSWGSGGYTCGDPFFPDEGDGVFTDGSEVDSDPIDPVYPYELDKPDNGGVLPADDGDGDPGDNSPALTKTVEDTTHTDGNTYAEDVLEYDITLTNAKIGTTWRNVMLFDYLPDELQLDRNSLVLVRPDGTRQKVSADSVYNSKTHIIMMTIATLKGGETYSLRYKAQIVVDDPPDEPAEEIVNTVTASAEDENGLPVEFDGGPEADASVSWPIDVGQGDGAGAGGDDAIDAGAEDGVTWVGHWVRRLKAKAALAATGDSALVACGFALAGAAVAAGGVWAARRRARGGSRVRRR